MVNIPPLLLGAATLFWGWQAGLSEAAVLMALILELRGRISFRLALSQKDFNNISDLCALMFAGIAAYAYFTSEASEAIMKIFRWIPLVFFPLLTAQLYSARGKIDLSAFFLFLRRQAEQEGFRWEIDLAFPFVAQCLVSAGGANDRGVDFYAGVCLLSAWALWGLKPRRLSRPAWGALFAAVAAAGFAGQDGLHRAERFLESNVAGFAYRMVRGHSSPDKAFTAIGHVGRLKMSDHIVLRVRVGEGKRPPALLHDATYDTYRSFQWFVKAPRSDPAGRGRDEGAWVLTGAAGGERLELSAMLAEGRGVLTLPRNAVSVEGLPAAALARNEMGTVEVTDGPPYLRYTVNFGGAADESGPSEADTAVPEGEQALLKTLAGELGLSPDHPEESAAAVARFFQGFEYSIYKDRPRSGGDVLRDFLLVSRSGHCEYFATATVLLLRAAGIPARYATGFAVREYSRLERAYVVRGRHAHAWARVGLDGKWADLDTTPSGWPGIEEKRASMLRPLFDLFSWGGDRFNRWRWRDSRDGSKRTVVLILLAILAFPLWRVLSGLRPASLGMEGGAARPARKFPGQDSELYEIERALAAAGLGRRVCEPVQEWLARLDASRLAGSPAAALRPIAALHGRYRFDPRGLDARQRRQLRDLAQDWLGEFQKTSIS